MWQIDPECIEWEMAWEPRHLYPGKPEKEAMFEKEGALAHLFVNSVIYVNNFWYEKEWPEDAQKCINIFVSCGDTFAYACADAERLHYTEIEELYQMWKKDPSWGATAWCVKKRKERPISPVEKALRERGYDLDSWELRDNTTNAEVQASFAYAAAKSRGLVP